MNVTENEFKDRQFHTEGYLQRVSAEQKENAEVSDHSRMGELLCDGRYEEIAKYYR